MDNLRDTISNISIYDVKAYVRKAQNVVMNLTEMEAKVREATNNEPWGASSTLMQEIADGTNSYTHFHEIMPMIYKRFTEKSAEEWRQIYKALQLLEFLVKNGSERVVDYARSHSAVIDMLKHFHYIDHNGKDQGINIRNRAKELLSLLSDVDKIRAERKKARQNKAKYSGIGNEASGFGGTGRKYGGFGSESLEFGGGYEGRVFGDGGGFDGSNYRGPGYSNDDDFEEYQVPGAGDSYHEQAAPSSSTSASKPAPKPEPVADFISFDDEPPAQTQPTAASSSAAAKDDDDDDFDDFQSAPGPSTSAAAPTNNAKQQINDLFAAMQSTPTQPPAQPTAQPALSAQSTAQSAAQPSPALGGFSSFASNVPQQPVGGMGQAQPMSMGSMGMGSMGSGSQSQPKKKTDDAFGSLWETAAKRPKPQQTSSNNSLGNLAQETIKNNIWGQSQANSQTSQTSSQPQTQSSSQNQGSIDDLLI
uniref:ARAD1A07480p n=1 Tax=Blastobotrys adeninivorans TaxID=409370 RepID=A0A060T2D5_BLAAD